VQTGSVEQARQVEEIVSRIDHIRRVTVKATLGARDSAAAGDELTGQAQNLREIVDRLVRIVGS